MAINTANHKAKPAIITGLTATGSIQANAFALVGNGNHEFTTVASGTGAILPSPALPSEIAIYNAGANALLVYPPVGGTINGGTVNASVSLAAAAAITYWASSGLNWYIKTTGGGGGSGTVTTASVVTANGFGGSVATATTTPAITISTSVTGLLKGNGTSVSAATAGTDYLVTLPTIPTLDILANTTGGTAAPAGVTLSAAIDAVLGSTQGDILYRGASAWSVLAPGTSGQFLETQGAAANPQWASAGGTGTVTSVATGTGLTGGPITASGTVSLATIPTLNVLANTTGGTAAPAGVTLSAAIDAAIGSTQGDILVRGASVWSALAPAASTQKVLKGDAVRWENATVGQSWVKLSDYGLTSDTVVTSGSTTPGADQSPAFQTVLNLAANGPVNILVDESFTCNTTPYVRSNTNLQGLNKSCGWMIGSTTYQVALANYEVNALRASSSNSWAGVGTGLGRTLGNFCSSNIGIRGLSINGNYANNNASGVVNGSGSNIQQPTSVLTGGVAYQDFIFGIRMWGVNGLTIDDVDLFDFACWAVSISNCDNISIPSLFIDQQASGVLNSNFGRDGLDLVGPIGTARIGKLNVRSNDDGFTVAPDALITTATTLNWMQPGPQQNIDIDSITLGLNGAASQFGVRVLSTFQRLERLRVGSITGVTKYAWLLCEGANAATSYPTGFGNIGTIHFGNVDVTVTAFTSSLSPGMAWIASNIESFAVDSLNVTKFPVTSLPCFYFGPINNSSAVAVAMPTIKSFRVGGINYKETGTANAGPLVSNAGARVVHTRLGPGVVGRSGAIGATLPALNIATGSIGVGHSIVDVDLVTDGVVNAISHVSGVLGTVRSSGVMANAGASSPGWLSVASGLTVTNHLHADLAAAVAAVGSGTVTNDIGAGTYADPALGAGLGQWMVSYWTLGEASGAARADSIGYAPLTDHGTVGQTTGQIGEAALFNGTTNYLSSTSTSLAVVGMTFFVVARFKVTTLPSSQATIIARRNSGGSLAIDYDIDIESTGQVLFFLSANDGSTYTSLAWGTDLTASSTWHTVIAYYDALNNVMGLSIDGGTFTTKTPSFTPVSSAASDLFTLGGLGTGGSYLSGAIDAAGVGYGYVPQASDATTFWNGGAGYDYFTGI